MSLARKNLRIVVVDDEKNDFELLEAMLIKAGFAYPLTHLANGGIALEHFKCMKETGLLAPHIVLLDINMPLIDGVNALTRLRKASYFRDLPVIILTATEDPAKKRELTHLGIFRFLKKLPDCANVITALDDFISFCNDEAASSATQPAPAFWSWGKSLALKEKT